MAQQFTNNARALLVAGISYTATSFVVESSKADLFPVANTGTGSIPAATSWFKATLQNASGDVEIVYVRTRTAGSGVCSNVIRGREGTNALNFVAGTVVGLRVTAQDLQMALDITGQDNTFTGDNTFAGDNQFSGTNTFTGPVVLPTTAVGVTQSAGNNSTAVSTTAFVTSAVDAAITAERTAAVTLTNKTIASPSLTGTPVAPTAAVNTNTTQVATTAYVVAQIADDAPTKTGGNASGTWNINITGNAATATSAVTAATSTNGFGVDQSWQGVSRGSGTWYQNTTGKAIMVFARWGTFAAAVSFSVNPSAPSYSGATSITFTDGDSGDSGDYGIIVVPVNHYYTCDNWGDARELR